MVQATGLWSRRERRIVEIRKLGHLVGKPVDLDYLYSCDIRALPVILDQLDQEARRRAQPRPWERLGLGR